MTEYQNDEQLEKMVADKAVELGLLKAAQLTECIDLQNNMRPLGIYKTLHEILVQKGYISGDIWQKMLDKQLEKSDVSLPEIAEEIPENIDALFSKANEKSVWKSFPDVDTGVTPPTQHFDENRISSISTEFLDKEISSTEIQIEDNAELETTQPELETTQPGK